MSDENDEQNEELNKETGLTKPDGASLAEIRRIYAPPIEFDGTQEEFNLLTGNLQPFHCSYPEGQHIDPRTGLPCRRKKDKHGHCSLHTVVHLPTAIGNTNPRMRKRLSAFFEDLNLESSRTNLAVSEMVLQERLAMLDTSESKSFMEMIASACVRISKCLEDLEPLINEVILHEELNGAIMLDPEEDPASEEAERARRGPEMRGLHAQIQGAINSLDRGAAIRKRKHDALEALSRANVESVRVKESASKMDQDRDRVISKEHAARMTVEVIDIYLQAIERFIDDNELKRQMLSFVHEAASRLRSGI